MNFRGNGICLSCRYYDLDKKICEMEERFAPQKREDCFYYVNKNGELQEVDTIWRFM